MTRPYGKRCWKCKFLDDVFRLHPSTRGVELKPFARCGVRFGKTEEEFATPEEYNDYIEKREDLSELRIQVYTTPCTGTLTADRLEVFGALT